MLGKLYFGRNISYTGKVYDDTFSSENLINSIEKANRTVPIVMDGQ